MNVMCLVYMCCLVMYMYGAADDDISPRGGRRASLPHLHYGRITTSHAASSSQGSEEFVAMASAIKSLPKLKRINEVLKESISWGYKEVTLPRATDFTAKPHPLVLTAIACSSTGADCFFGYSNGQLYRWNVCTDTCREVGAHVESVTALACTADGSTLFSASRDREVYAWDLLNETQESIGRGQYKTLACSADGRYIFAAPDKETEGVLELTQQEKQPTFKFPAPVKRVVCTADGMQVFSVQTNRRCITWNRLVQEDKPKEPKKTNRLRSHLAPGIIPVTYAGLACDITGARVFSSIERETFQLAFPKKVSSAKNEIVSVYGPACAAGEMVASLACDAEGAMLFVGTSWGNVYQYRIDDKDSIHTMGKVKMSLSGLQLMDDGSTAVQGLVCNSDASRVFCMSHVRLSFLYNDFMAILKSLSAESITLLIQTIEVAQETGRPCVIEVTDERWVEILKRIPELVNGKICVTSENYA